MALLILAILGVYALVMAVFLISENRRPQATLAWLLSFVFLPGLGLLIYLLFGRGRRAFSRASKLLRQELEPHSRPLLQPIMARQDAAMRQIEELTVAHRKLMKLIRRNSQSALTVNNCVDILQDAAAFYPRLVDDVKQATHSIHFQYFTWRSDAFTEQMAEILAAKVREGVSVRILYDPIGSQETTRAYWNKLRAAGVQVAPTTPAYWLHTISYRNHRKITVIDGVIAYTGGMNIGHEHLDGGDGFDCWRDTQVRIVGEAAAVLQSVFMVDWYNAVKEDLFCAEYYPCTDPASAAEASSKAQRDGEHSEGNVPVQILTSGPDSRWAAIRQLYTNMIMSAEHHVVLQSPYFVLDSRIAEALTSAALSGVDVKVMLSARPSGNRLPAWAGNTYMAEIVRSGVRVFLYDRGYLHAKTISIDSQICSIGSANIDIRSFSINYEVNAVLYSSALAARLEQDFERDLLGCHEFDVAAYAKLPALERFRDSVARLLSPLL